MQQTERSDAAPDPVRAARLARARERLEHGAYELPQLAEEVARRLLDSGEL